MPRLRPWILALIVLICLAHCWYRSFLIDDAYISFRYARNLVEGHGLVFNPGERVEGYTNFLWTLMIAGAMQIGLVPETVARGIGIVSALALLIVLYRWGIDRGLGAGWALVAPAMLAVSRSYAAWATSGLETRFFTLLVVAAAWWFDRERDSRSPTGALPMSAVLFGLAALTRPEGILAAGVACAGLVVSLLRGRPVAGYLLRWSAPLAVMIGGQLIWRVWYYGEWLPNSFHAKVPGARILSGTVYLASFGYYYVLGPVLVAALAVGMTRTGARGWSSREAWTRWGRFPIPFLLVYVLYVLVIGGDHFEFRFMDPVLPMIFLVLVGLCPLSGSQGAVLQPHQRRVATAAGALFVIVAGFPALAGFPEIDRRIRLGGKEHYVSVVSVEGEVRYLEYWKRIGLWLHENAAPGESIAVAPAGAIPYFSRLRTLDMLGINDHEIARLPIKPGQNVGHERWVDNRYVRDRGIHYLIASPAIQTRPAASPRGRIVEVKLEGFYWYFWVLRPDASIQPSGSP